MNFLQRMVSGVAHGVGLSASDPKANRNPNDPRMWTALGMMSMAGVAVTAQNAESHWAVRACTEALAGPISTLSIGVFERLPGGKRKLAADHPLYRVLRQPNRRQTSQEYRSELERHLAIWRNAYSIILPAEDGGPVGSLEQVHPSRLQKIERASDGWIYYHFRRISPATGTDVYREDFVWHIRKAPLTEDGLRGKYLWETDFETIGKALAVEQFGSLFFANGGTGGGTLEHPGSFKSKEEQENFLETWRAGGTGLNRHKDRLLLYGLQYKPFQVKNNESQFLETKKQSGYEVASIFNMPPHRVGMLERATNNNIEQQSIEFVMYTLGPDIAAFEQAANRDLLVGEDQDRFFVEINVASLLRGDIKTRWASYALGRQWGWLSVNDIRRMENMDPIGEEGDHYLTPLNMVPASDASPPSNDNQDNKDSQNA